MATLKEFEDALREAGNEPALAILDALRRRDRAQRQLAPARRVTGRKMTPELAAEILKLHAATTMTQQEIAFQLGVNQGRVNEVVKRGKWLSGDPSAPEAVARDRAMERMDHTVPASMMPAPAKVPARAEAEPALFADLAEPRGREPAAAPPEPEPAAEAPKPPKAARRKGGAKRNAAEAASPETAPRPAEPKPAAPKPDSRQLSLGDF